MCRLHYGQSSNKWKHSMPCINVKGLCSAEAGGSLYQAPSTDVDQTKPHTFCFHDTSPTIPLRSDYMTAIAQLPKTGVCTAIASNNTGNDGQVGYYKTFAVFGTCQVSLGAFFAATVSLPCSQLATYATNVVNACQTSQAPHQRHCVPNGKLSKWTILTCQANVGQWHVCEHRCTLMLTQ